MVSLLSKEECNHAAIALGLSDITADSTGWDGPPQGCIEAYKMHHRLMMNTPYGIPHTTLPCGSEYFFSDGEYKFDCLCSNGKNFSFLVKYLSKGAYYASNNQISSISLNRGCRGLQRLGSQL